MGKDSTDPEWLNEDFLHCVLLNELKGESVVINKYNKEPAVSVGDHFASSLYRVVVDFTYSDDSDNEVSGTSRMIVKSLPAGDVMRKMVVDAKLFKRETEVYLVTLPAMYNLLEEVSGSKAEHITSKCIYSKPNVLVLKDLCDMGYVMADRRSGLDISQCKVALRNLARFHGMSVALYNKDKRYMDNFGECFYIEERRSILEESFVPGLECLASVVEKWPDYERFGDKLRKLAEVSVNRIIDIVKPSPNSLSVLNHGDFWVNNILFKYSDDSDEAVDAKFVDFQVCRFSSPALDLQYFINTSPSEDIRFENTNELLEFYHSELVQIMNKLDCGHIEFTFEQLKQEYEDKTFFGVIHACTLLHLVLGDRKDSDAEKENTEDEKTLETDPTEKGYANPLFRDQFQKLLIHYENINFL